MISIMKLGWLYIPSQDEIYLRGQRSRIEKLQNAAEAVGIQSASLTPHNSIEMLTDLKQVNPDVVFSISDEITGENGTIQNVHQILEAANIPYIGSASESLKLCRSKPALKAALQKNGIATPEFVHLQHPCSSVDLHAKIGKLRDYPYIVKPASLGNSAGIAPGCMCHDLDSLVTRIEMCLPRYGDILVEKYLGLFPDFQEFTVALIGNPPRAMQLPAEVRFKEAGIHRAITREDKDRHRTVALPVRKKVLRHQLATIAGKVFQIARMRDYARCDILLGGGLLQVIEVNGQPMIPDLWFEACAAGADLNGEQTLQAILFAGLSRLQVHHAWLKIPAALSKRLAESTVNILRL